MTVNAARRTRRRAEAPTPEPAVAAPVGSLAIGEIDQTVFDCPTCSRPLALGARRCPGCRTRLVMGIPLRKASTFAVFGVAVGLVAGSAGAFAVAATRVAGAAPGTGTVLPTAAPVAVVSPSSSPAATPAPSEVVGPSSDMPPAARSALGQAITLDERLIASARTLQAAALASPFDASDVAQILREISADSVYGQQLADRVSTWPDSASAGADLKAFYTSIHDTAAEALVNSVRNETAYRQGARAMIVLLAAAPALDGRLRDLATTNGVAIPTPVANP